MIWNCHQFLNVNYQKDDLTQVVWPCPAQVPPQVFVKAFCFTGAVHKPTLADGVDDGDQETATNALQNKLLFAVGDNYCFSASRQALAWVFNKLTKLI